MIFRDRFWIRALNWNLPHIRLIVFLAIRNLTFANLHFFKTLDTLDGLIPRQFIYSTFPDQINWLSNLSKVCV